MKLKPGVKVRGIRPETILILLAAHPIWVSYGVPKVRVTSCGDGAHRPNSKHYTGCAVDLGVHELLALGVDVARVVRELAEALGDEYDVIHEAAGTANEHVHAEWDPKGPG